jgi:hypothetical protein
MRGQEDQEDWEGNRRKRLESEKSHGLPLTPFSSFPNLLDLPVLFSSLLPDLPDLPVELSKSAPVSPKPWDVVAAWNVKPRSHPPLPTRKTKAKPAKLDLARHMDTMSRRVPNRSLEA